MLFLFLFLHEYVVGGDEAGVGGVGESAAEAPAVLVEHLDEQFLVLAELQVVCGVHFAGRVVLNGDRGVLHDNFIIQSELCFFSLGGLLARAHVAQLVLDALHPVPQRVHLLRVRLALVLLRPQHLKVLALLLLTVVRAAPLRLWPLMLLLPRLVLLLLPQFLLLLRLSLPEVHDRVLVDESVRVVVLRLLHRRKVLLT